MSSLTKVFSHSLALPSHFPSLSFFLSLAPSFPVYFASAFVILIQGVSFDPNKHSFHRRATTFISCLSRSRCCNSASTHHIASIASCPIYDFDDFTESVENGTHLLYTGDLYSARRNGKYFYSFGFYVNAERRIDKIILNGSILFYHFLRTF